MEIDINLKSEYIVNLFGIGITNTFLTSIMVSFVVVIISIYFYVNRDNMNNRFVRFVYMLSGYFFDFINSIIKNKNHSKRIFPIIATLFIFILFANMLALLPGFLGSFYVSTPDGHRYHLLKSPNSDLTITLALAICAMVSVQIYSIKNLGLIKFLGRFLNFSSPIKFVLGFFELISESVKVISFSFRLFGNIFAGEVLLIIIAFLVPYLVPLPFMIMEVFVGLVQAFIFAILTVTFMKISTVDN